MGLIIKLLNRKGFEDFDEEFDQEEPENQKFDDEEFESVSFDDNFILDEEEVKNE